MRIRCFTILRIHKYSIHSVESYSMNSIEFIILWYTFLVTFSKYKEYMICAISFKKFLDVLPAFTCARAIVNL